MTDNHEEKFEEYHPDTTGRIKGIPLMIIGSDEEAESPHLVRIIDESLNEARLYFDSWGKRWEAKCVSVAVLFDESGKMVFHARETDF